MVCPSFVKRPKVSMHAFAGGRPKIRRQSCLKFKIAHFGALFRSAERQGKIARAGKWHEIRVTLPQNAK